MASVLARIVVVVAVTTVTIDHIIGDRFGHAVVPDHHTIIHTLEMRRHRMVSALQEAVGEVGAAGRHIHTGLVAAGIDVPRTALKTLTVVGGHVALGKIGHNSHTITVSKAAVVFLS